MKKSIVLSLCVISTLYAVENSTQENIYGLYFGTLDQATSRSELGERSRVDAILGCMHNRGGSDRIGFEDCTQITQIYAPSAAQSGILYKPDVKIDGVIFRDNIWCMESDNDNLGQNKKPNLNDFVSDIYNNKNELKINEEKEFTKTSFSTKVYKYKESYYQESYKNLSVNTTGVLKVISSGKKPFSFYLARNYEFLSDDVQRFAKDYVGIQSNMMSMDFSSRDEYMYSGIYQGAADSMPRYNDGNVGVRPYFNACNYYGVIDYDEKIKKNSKFGCDYFNQYSKLNEFEKYTLFYNSLEKDYKCNIHKTNANDVLADIQGNKNLTGIEFYAVTNEKGNTYEYRLYPSNVIFGQYNSDLDAKKNAKNLDLSVLIKDSNTCKMAVEGLSIKNILTYSPANFNNGFGWDFLDKKSDDLKTFKGVHFGWGNKIGKCYFANMQYYDKRTKTKDYTPFEAITAYDFFYDKKERFLQNNINNSANAYYSIHRDFNDIKGIYTSHKTQVEHNFTLNTRPTSFRKSDINSENTIENGKINADYTLVFYPDANNVSKTKISQNYNINQVEIKNAMNFGISEKSFDLVSSLQEGDKNNFQIQFKYNESLINVDRLSDNKFNIEADVLSYELEAVENAYFIKNKANSKSIKLKNSDYMALRLDNNFLNAINFANKPLLLAITITKGEYANNQRPFYETIQQSPIIEGSKKTIYVVIDANGFVKNDDLNTTEFGTIYDANNPNSSKTPILSSNSTRLVNGKAYTRIIGQPVYLGIKNNIYSNDKDIYITFKANKINSKENVDFIYKDTQGNVKSTVNEVMAEGKELYPYSNGTIELNNLNLGKYEVCYAIYSKNEIKKAKELNLTPNYLESNCTTHFSIRPAYIEYLGKNDFNAGANSVNTTINAKLYDLNDKEINMSNYEFGLTKALLNVKKSDEINDDDFNKGYNFNLSNTKKFVIDNIHTADFNKNNVEIKVEFPFATDTKIRLYEGKFTNNDRTNALCSDNILLNANDDLLRLSNTINNDGKVNCITPSKKDLEINFNSTASEYKLINPILNDTTPEKVFFTNTGADGHKLTLPFVINDTGDGLDYVYKKFSSDYELAFDLKLNNKDLNAVNRYLITKANKTIVNNKEITGINSNLIVKSVDKEQIKALAIISKKDLNAKFDKKLEEFYNKTNTNAIDTYIKDFAANENELNYIINLAYSKYFKTTDNISIDKNLVLLQPQAAEFKLLNTSTSSFKNLDTNKEIKDNLNKNYSFIFTGLVFKDAKAKLGATSHKLDSKKDIQAYYLNELSQRAPLTNAQYTKLGEITAGLELNMHYKSQAKKIGLSQIEVQLNAANQNKQYLKEVIDVKNSDDFHGASFTLEFQRD